MKETFKLLDLIESCILVIDNKLDVIFANKSAHEFFSFTTNPSESVSMIELLQEKDRRFCQKIFNSFIVDLSKAHHIDLAIPDRQGELYNVSLSFNLMQDSSQSLFIVNTKINQQINDESCKNNSNEAKYLKAIFDNTSYAIFLAPISPDGVHGNFVKVNREACERLGYTEAELLQLNARTINPEANMEKIRSFGMTIKKEGRALFEAIHQAKDGSRIPVEVNASIISIDDSRYILSMVKDLRNYKKLQNSETLFGKLMDHSWNELYVFDSKNLKIIRANKGALDNLGVTEEQALQSSFTDFLPNKNPQEFLKFTRDLFSGDKSQLVYETIFHRKNGTSYPVEVRLQLSHSEVPPVFLAIVQDITERKKIEERLTTLANYDVLTGLPNRTLFMDRLNMAMKSANRTETLVALMFIDLDGFKNINDSWGHEAGDELLKEVAHRLKNSVRETDSVARLGGDEFTVILTNLRQVDDVDKVVEKIQTSVNQPINLRGKKAHVSPSIGIAIYPLNDINDAYELIRHADMAMYQAKHSGKNTHKYFSSTLCQIEARTIEMENQLREALELNELQPYFQPRLDLKSGKIVSAEVLLRWNNKVLGFVSPVEFVPVLEKNGMINEVGMWVVAKSTEYLKVWHDMGALIKLSINVSARQFEDPQFIAKLTDTILKSSVNPSFLEFEVTEGLLISQSSETAQKLQEIKDLGCHISLDDFGTGYSSLSYLKQFPIDVLKIDRSFVMDMTINQDSMAIVKAIIGLAKSLGRSVTAEGIETAEHVAILKELECEEGQGFYFAKPMPATEMQAFLFKS